MHFGSAVFSVCSTQETKAPPKMSVTISQSTWCCIPKDPVLHEYHCESLRFCIC